MVSETNIKICLFSNTVCERQKTSQQKAGITFAYDLMRSMMVLTLGCNNIFASYRNLEHGGDILLRSLHRAK